MFDVDISDVGLNAVLQWLRSFIQCPRCGGSSLYSSWIIQGEQVVCSLCDFPRPEKSPDQGIDQLLLLELGAQAWLSDLTKKRLKEVHGAEEVVKDR